MPRHPLPSQDNLLVIGLTICLGLIPLLLYCCWPSSGGSDYEPDDVPLEEEPPEPPAEEEPEPEADEATVEDITEEKEGKKPAAKQAARKRTQKTS